MNYSFFYAAGGSGYIRGYQMAERLGGKHNPTSGYENDLCIYVKIIPPDNYPMHTYCDVDDSGRQLEWLKTHTNTGVIAISEYARDNMRKILNRNDIYFIPHQHINFEGYMRPERPIKTVGIIGCKTSFQYPVEEFRQRLKEMDMELFYNPDYWDSYKTNEKQEMRLNILDAYKGIDIQVAYRHKRFAHDALRNPNKLANAGALGIPNVAYAEASYEREWAGSYIPILRMDQMLWAIKELKDNDTYYRYWQKKGLKKAQEYSMEKIEQLYRSLP